MPESQSLKHQRSFALFWVMRLATTTAFFMLTVAVGWQIYDMTGSALDLGYVGLVQFVPFVLLAVVVGPIVDRVDRRAIARTCQIAKAVCTVVLAIGSAKGWLTREAIFAVLFVIGTARVFETPTLHALVPGLVPVTLLPRAIAASATANQTSVICGPALGGLLYGFGPTVVYTTCAVVFVIASVLVSMIPRDNAAREKRPISIANILAGFAFIWQRPLLLGAITLDLLSVMLGGVTALLPIYAKDILMTGPEGLGFLRSAPAVGALGMSIFLAHHAIERRAGTVIFATTAIFGLSALAFALSNSLWLSCAALVVYGASDAISVVIRHALVQIRTPRDMLGRVMAVNSLFTGTSTTLGEFRAGAMAAAFGATAAAVAGGIGTVLVVLLWARIFPDLRRVKTLTPGEEG